MRYGSVCSGIEAATSAWHSLGWKLPKDFYPDCYITFDSDRAMQSASWPSGTNLMHAGQVRDMLNHVLGDAK